MRFRSRFAAPLGALTAAALLVVPLAGVASAKPGKATPPATPPAAAAEHAPVFASESDVAATADSRVVVAVIDSSTNPYHDFFQTEQSSVTPAVLAEFGIDEAHTLSLTRTGDFAADYAADKERIWDQVKPGEPYWFAGTNVIAISFEDFTDPAERPILPDGARDTHGVGTTAAVLKGNPEAIVVLVEGINNEAETWAFTHPAVDAVSTSYGFPGSPPLGFHLEDSHTGVVELGKHHFGAADNSPALSPFDGTSGPWWVIGVAGFQEGSTEGRQVLSGTLPDFVGDFTQTLPYCWNCETAGERAVSGTSFATPISAGTFSEVLLEARRAAGHVGGIRTDGDGAPRMVEGNGITLTNWQLRRALEEGAYYPKTSDFNTSGSAIFDRTSVPVVDAAPWATTAWGAITPDPEHGVVAETLRHAGIGGAPTRTKSAEACAFMTANIDARQAYWDNLAIDSESLGSDADPYVDC